MTAESGMNLIKDLNPKEVFFFFGEICSIPHGSYHTKSISDYCVAFAEKRGLPYKQDANNNVLIEKDATKGYESAPTIILQGHLDMVCAKDGDVEIDMNSQPVIPYIDGDFVRAKKTSLGADNGIAVAMILGILDSSDIPHPRLEALFTSDEEIGMLGASALDASSMKGKRLLNIDSEKEGVLTVSCAGAVTVRASFPVKNEISAGDIYSVTVSGGKGGHSGIEIHNGHANANCLLADYLCRVSELTKIKICNISGGEKENAIPGKAKVAIEAKDSDVLQRLATVCQKEWAQAYGQFDPDICISVEKDTVVQQSILDADSTQKVISLLSILPTGVVELSPNIEGLVQTSVNLGVVSMEEAKLQVTLLVRSSLSAQRDAVVRKIACAVKSFGGTLQLENAYPAWEYQENSPLRDLSIKVFKELYHSEPKVEALHAGLECGILCGKIKDLDCVSYGPDLVDVHTHRERLSISSLQRVWRYTLELLRQAR